MNIRLRFVAWLLVIAVSTSGQSFGGERVKRHTTTTTTTTTTNTTPDRRHDTTQDFEVTTADALIARPLWFAATAVGSAIFVVTLPIAAMSKSVNKTAKTLVVRPAQATFTRPLGDFSTVD